MHTSHGRYRLFGLPFGITIAPDEFHTRLTSALEGSNATIRIADDIRVYGEGNKLRFRRFIAYPLNETLPPKIHQSQGRQTFLQA